MDKKTQEELGRRFGEAGKALDEHALVLTQLVGVLEGGEQGADGVAEIVEQLCEGMREYLRGLEDCARIVGGKPLMIESTNALRAHARDRHAGGRRGHHQRAPVRQLAAKPGVVVRAVADRADEDTCAYCGSPECEGAQGWACPDWCYRCQEHQSNCDCDDPLIGDGGVREEAMLAIASGVGDRETEPAPTRGRGDNDYLTTLEIENVAASHYAYNFEKRIAALEVLAHPSIDLRPAIREAILEREREVAPKGELEGPGPGPVDVYALVARLATHLEGSLGVILSEGIVCEDEMRDDRAVLAEARAFTGGHGVRDVEGDP